MFRKLVFAVLGLMVLGVVVTAVHDIGKSPEQIAAEREAYQKAESVRHRTGIAEVTCQMEAERRANDPSSIDWLREEREFSYKNKQETIAISRQPMRAKNGFGAIVRASVTCELKREKENWRVTKISMR